MPEVTLTLPMMFGIAVLLLAVGAGTVFAILQGMTGGAPIAVAAATETPTPTITTTITATPTETATVTATPTATLEPPIEYKVASGDTCLGIALAYEVSSNAIVVLNGLPAACDTLYEGQILKIPRPTPTAQPTVTNTPNATEIAAAECEKVEYEVKDNDTLGGIAANYGVSQASVRAYNNMTSDIVYPRQKLIIPLCEQVVETPTPTPIPPYASPNLLLPQDGAAYTNPSDVITLQWASVGELRENEAYAVTIEDVTEGNARKLVDYLTDNKYIVPESFRPTSNTPHVFRWSVLTVRQTGTDKEKGNPVWEPAGSVSAQRVFSWVGTGSPAPLPSETPKPQ